MSKKKKEKVQLTPYAKAVKARTAKNVAGIFINVLFLCFLALLVIAIVFSISFKKDGQDGTDLFGTHMVITSDATMKITSETDVSNFDVKSINQYSMVFMDTVPENIKEAETFYKNIKVGDVLTYSYNSKVYTQRVTKIEGSVISLKGDTTKATYVRKVDTASENSNKYIIGKVHGQSFFLGLLVTCMYKPLGYTCVFVLPCILIVCIELLRFYNMKTEREQELIVNNENQNLLEIKVKLALKNIEVKDKSNESAEG